MNAQENEQEAVRTTIVGGRPPGSGRSNVNVPRGIEVLVKKAAVDPEFRELLFEQRGGAAAAIELELDPAENAMLNAIPQEQLAQIIGQTTVPMEQRRVFLGRIATAMLAVLGASLTGCSPSTRGTRSDLPEQRLAKADTTTPTFSTLGSQPDQPVGGATNYALPGAPAGIRPEPPRTNRPPAKQPRAVPASTNKPAAQVTRGIRPDRP